MLVASDPTVLVVFCVLFTFLSLCLPVLPRLSIATTSRDYSSRAARLGFPVVCLCCASEHNSPPLLAIGVIKFLLSSGTTFYSWFIFLSPQPSIVAIKNVDSNFQACGLHYVSSPYSHLDYFSQPLEQISTSVHQLGNNPSHLLHLVKDLPSRAQNLLISGECLVKSLTCNNLDQFLLEPPQSITQREPPCACASSREPSTCSLDCTCASGLQH
ncbi:hypothetical protein DSO57_1027027 [Entomophthora muscae]|uniref:Uncharacterized protein n=1 Tax=Entomophthora muscae TaxID=34485 RepID=A0ACC2TD01_9FUNG|nr:hypothetical protein DSO57_1027027 [Entomophthora muscae]